MKKIGIEDLKKIELELLIDFDKICKAHNLRYFLIGGTLLGAVRHKGFIPWDDDIDVGMPRSDYEILMKNAVDWLPKHISLRNWKNTKDYVYQFSKIENNKTILIENKYEHLKSRKGGVYIDVFPFDRMLNKTIFRFIWFGIIRFINRLLVLMRCNTPVRSVVIQ